jgi:hypothetical protein
MTEVTSGGPGVLPACIRGAARHVCSMTAASLSRFAHCDSTPVGARGVPRVCTRLATETTTVRCWTPGELEGC